MPLPWVFLPEIVVIAWWYPRFLRAPTNNFQKIVDGTLILRRHSLLVSARFDDCFGLLMQGMHIYGEIDIQEGSFITIIVILVMIGYPLQFVGMHLLLFVNIMIVGSQLYITLIKHQIVGDTIFDYGS